MFLTYLHFDHCGGSVKWNNEKTDFELTFKNANYWSNKKHWEWAKNPNSREKHFLKENIIPIEKLVKLNLLKKGGLFYNFSTFFVNAKTQNLK